MPSTEIAPTGNKPPQHINNEFANLYSDLETMKLELILHYIEKIDALQAGKHSNRLNEANLHQALEHYQSEIEYIRKTDSSDPIAMALLERRYISVMNEKTDRKAA